ncbi:hypothetical protein CC80DRAFT_503850 [Byssothecium circinans]|uniref:Uncharacterized protein n=1 Tax=Byssothecium circinans TaxID=147558 RepID=A0A6A5TZN7_9PLEO|nr:hypothetical protein CC80DRAFT_503850 [Byssothecium circinans]
MSSASITGASDVEDQIPFGSKNFEIMTRSLDTLVKETETYEYFQHNASERYELERSGTYNPEPRVSLPFKIPRWNRGVDQETIDLRLGYIPVIGFNPYRNSLTQPDTRPFHVRLEKQYNRSLNLGDPLLKTSMENCESASDERIELEVFKKEVRAIKDAAGKDPYIDRIVCFGSPAMITDGNTIDEKRYANLLLAARIGKELGSYNGDREIHVFVHVHQNTDPSPDEALYVRAQEHFGARIIWNTVPGQTVFTCLTNSTLLISLDPDIPVRLIFADHLLEEKFHENRPVMVIWKGDDIKSEDYSNTGDEVHDPLTRRIKRDICINYRHIKELNDTNNEIALFMRKDFFPNTV